MRRMVRYFRDLSMILFFPLKYEIATCFLDKRDFVSRLVWYFIKITFLEMKNESSAHRAGTLILILFSVAFGTCS